MITFLGFDRRDLAMGANLLGLSFRDKFLGTALGRFWAIATPTLLLTIFTVIFTFVFHTKRAANDTPLAFVIWMFSGYGPWLSISEGVNAGASSVTSNSGLVKNIAFKSELLPMVAVIIGLMPLLVSLVYLSGLIVADGRAPSWSWLSMIVVLALQIILVWGVAFFLASLNVFMRDIALLIPNILLILLFCSPIFYTIDSYPEQVRNLFVWNPLYVIAEGYRRPILENQMLPWNMWLYLAAVSFAAFFFGLRYFRKLKTYFDTRL